jgi:N-acetylmuramoyl-L-alanine amidase
LNSPVIHKNPLPYEGRLELRDTISINLVVIHCTELPDLETARQYGEKIHYSETQTGNSGHFYIDRDGCIEQWVDPLRVAHHVAGMNENSIGIELVNLGRYPNWLHSEHQEMQETYPKTQITALNVLIDWLINKYPGLAFIAGHEDIDRREVPAADNPEEMVQRKLDPGPLFPWDEVLDTIPLSRRTT